MRCKPHAVKRILNSKFLKSTSFLNKIGDAYYLLIDAIKGYDRIRVAGHSYTRLAVESKFSSIE